MKLIDLHCDTVFKLYNQKSKRFYENEHQIDLKKLKSAGSYIQAFALFDSRDHYHYAYENLLEYIDYYHTLIEENEPHIHALESIKDVRQEKINALLTLEDGGSIGGKIERLQEVYAKGVRMAALSWNYENCFGYPNSSDEETMGKGLKKFGFEAVESMNELGMIVDVSHLSDRGFYDVVNTSKQPFVASHSNARAVADNPRNLTDDMIKRLADAGGICGVNFYAPFLGKSKISRIEDIINHIKHIHNVGGIDMIAIGTDFDGINCELEISDISKISLLYDALKKNGFSETDIEKIFYRNALRMMIEVLK